MISLLSGGVFICLVVGIMFGLPEQHVVPKSNIRDFRKEHVDSTRRGAEFDDEIAQDMSGAIRQARGF